MPVGTLPAAGKKIWERVYNEALSGSCKGDKECAARSAWSATKGAGWRKKDGKWTKKSNSIVEMPMYITKATYDGKTMRWAATNSDTDKDSYEERMSLELYEDFIGNIANKIPVPEEFKADVCSDYWNGGMPYVSISHYPDLNGQAVPGEPTEIYIDGDDKKYRLKAKGILFDTPLGHSVYRSLKEDKVKPSEEKIRISIGFLDLAHRHGENGTLWERKGRYSLCSECLQGIGDKIYVKGYLVHLALTRVPVNKRTEMVIEEKAMTKKRVTRKRDAESIVGKQQAEEIEVMQKATAQRSDALIEMSDAETPQETQELIAEVEKAHTMTDAEKKEKCMKEDGTIDEDCMKRMKEEHYKSEADEDAEPTGESVEDDEELTEDEEDSEEELVLESKVVEKFEDNTMDKVTQEPHEMDNMPYGGATSMMGAEKYLASKQEIMYLSDMWQVFSTVVWNIIERADIKDKRGAMNKAVDEFRSVLTAKAMLAFEVKSEDTPAHELQPIIDALLETVDNSVVLQSDIERAEAVNPALQQLGLAITDFFSKKSVKQDEPPAPNTTNENLIETIKNLLQPIENSVHGMSERVANLEMKSSAISQAQTVEARPRIPTPRTQTLPPNLLAKSKPVKQGSLQDIINKSVGL